MARAERFEDLIAWQKARQLTKAVYSASRHALFANDYGLSGQIQRASVSIMSNIAEGFERASPADYMRFLTMAKASCGEVRSQLYVALDIGYVSQQDFQALNLQAVEVSRVIGGLLASIKRSQ
jgi:four helix bundle protein